MDHPSTRTSKAVGALVGAIAALSIGGVGFAFAQDAQDTPTTEAPSATTPPAADATPAPAAPDDDCPEHDGARGGGAGGTTTTPAPSTSDPQV